MVTGVGFGGPLVRGSFSFCWSTVDIVAGSRLLLLSTLPLISLNPEIGHFPSAITLLDEVHDSTFGRLAEPYLAYFVQEVRNTVVDGTGNWWVYLS